MSTETMREGQSRARALETNSQGARQHQVPQRWDRGALKTLVTLLRTPPNSHAYWHICPHFTTYLRTSKEIRGGLTRVKFSSL